MKNRQFLKFARCAMRICFLGPAVLAWKQLTPARNVRTLCDMVTVDTITRQQLDELHQTAFKAGDLALEYACSDAKRSGVGKIAKARKAALIVCVAAWNARHGAVEAS